MNINFTSLSLGNINDEHNTKLCVPFAHTQSMVFEINNNANIVHQYIEQVVFDLLKNYKDLPLKVTIIDTSLQGNFKYLRAIKHNRGRIDFISDTNKIKFILKELNEEAQRRINILPTNKTTFVECDEEEKEDEIFQLIIFTNISRNAFSESLFNDFCNFISNAYKAGMYPIVSYAKANDAITTVIEREVKHLQQILAQGIYVKQQDKSESFELNFGDERLQNLGKFTQRYGFNFNAYELNTLKQTTKQLSVIFQGEVAKERVPVVQTRIGINKVTSKPFYLTIGGETQAYHGLLAGVTGSGKSALLRTIIWRFAKYSPDYLRLYLIDCGGVEFGVFEKHPNAEVLLLDDGKYIDKYEASLAILQKIELLLNERKVKFKTLAKQLKIRGIKNIMAYNEVAPEAERLPYIIGIVDEVQELFEKTKIEEQTKKLKDGTDIKEAVEVFDRAYHNKLSNTLSRIVKLARKYGAHLLFASQEFTNVKIPVKVKGQMAIRIAFELDSTEDYLAILGSQNREDFTNLKPFHAIYNGKASNSPIHNEIFKADYPIDENKKDRQQSSFYESKELKELLANAPKGKEFKRIIIDYNFTEDLYSMLNLPKPIQKKNPTPKPTEKLTIKNQQSDWPDLKLDWK